MKLDLTEARAILSRTPVVLREMLGQLPDPWLQSNEGPDTWTGFQGQRCRNCWTCSSSGAAAI
jgi:hypothetical protein